MNNAANQIDQRTWQPSLYEQLHRIAEKALQRETPGHSLQPTLLVNDAYMRLESYEPTPGDVRGAEGVGPPASRPLGERVLRPRMKFNPTERLPLAVTVVAILVALLLVLTAI